MSFLVPDVSSGYFMIELGKRRDFTPEELQDVADRLSLASSNIFGHFF